MILNFYRYLLQSGMNCVLKGPVFSTGFQSGVDGISDIRLHSGGIQLQSQRTPFSYLQFQ